MDENLILEKLDDMCSILLNISSKMNTVEELLVLLNKNVIDVEGATECSCNTLDDVSYELTNICSAVTAIESTVDSILFEMN